MPVKISNIDIACNTALDQENQFLGLLGEQDRISFMEYEEHRDTLEKEFYGVYDCCNETGYSKEINE